MRNKILIPVLILTALAAFFSFKYSGEDADAIKKNKLIVETIANALEQGHFSPRQLDDSFSARVYARFLERMDYDKRFLTQKDINQLAVYQYKIDDQIKAGSVEFFDKFTELYNNGINESEKYYKDILDKPFDFNTNDEYVSSGEDMPYPADEKGRKERWRQYLKFRALSGFVDMKKKQEKRVADKDSSLKVVKTDVEMEAESRKKVKESMDFFFKQVRKLDDEDKFALYMNAVTNTEDPHTDYFPPEDKERFDEAMSGSFFGIGARLQNDEGKIKITEVIAGTPAWKQGELKAGDEILKVAQGTQEAVDIRGYDINDAVKLIRGPRGSEVRLTVKHVNGAEKEVPIVRDEVQIEETFARSAVINTASGPVGYIYLPDFYANFQDANGRRCAEDVAIEVMKLKNASVNGIILDLRYNGGGSLNDVISMTGLFVDNGPIVQVKSSHSTPTTLEDRQSGTLYDGPLAIMVNHGSASASEILAAALQDYKRAVIVGSTTFGKGTVQKVISLDEYLKFSDRLSAKSNDEEIGALKLTIQKFYRVNGGSTQLRGVTPDIELPDPYEHLDMGERKDKSALVWDEIPAANYKVVSNPVNVKKLSELSNERVKSNASFNLIKENAERIKKQEDDKTYSLNEKKYKAELDEANATADKIKNAEEKTVKLNITNPKEDMAKINRDSVTIAKNTDWIKNLSRDIYLSETVNIINDMNKLPGKVSMDMRSK